LSTGLKIKPVDFLFDVGDLDVFMKKFLIDKNSFIILPGARFN
jgi:hypothetical protein